jgi:hypothetical protein
MAGWPEAALTGALAMVCAGTLMAANSVPAGQAENMAPPLRSGWVKPQRQGMSMLDALRDAVLADAQGAWPGVPATQLQLRVEAVTWGDGALGCAQPGVMYTQALVPGWRFLVRSPGHEAAYHASESGQWLHCPASQPQPRRGEPSTH